MKRIFLIILVLSISYVSSVYSEEKQSEPTLVTAPGFTNYQVQQNVTPEVFNSSGHIQETAPGLKSPYVGIFTGNQVDQVINGIRFNNSLFRSGPNQYYSWIPDSFVNGITVSDGGNVGGTISSYEYF